jgi:hypothetical protein
METNYQLMEGRVHFSPLAPTLMFYSQETGITVSMGTSFVPALGTPTSLCVALNVAVVGDKLTHAVAADAVNECFEQLDLSALVETELGKQTDDLYCRVIFTTDIESFQQGEDTLSQVLGQVQVELLEADLIKIASHWATMGKQLTQSIVQQSTQASTKH